MHHLERQAPENMWMLLAYRESNEFSSLRHRFVSDIPTPFKHVYGASYLTIPNQRHRSVQYNKYNTYACACVRMNFCLIFYCFFDLKSEWATE